MTTELRGGPWPAVSRRLIAAGVAVLILVGGAAMMLGRELFSPAAPDPPAQAADEFVAVEAPEAGLSISHPPGWRRVASSDPAVVLLAEGGSASMLVRKVDLGAEIGPTDLAEGKEISDTLVRAGKHELQRPPKQVTLGGLPGWLYLYTFPDAASGQEGAHAHYFLFRGQELITVVFQTLPAQRFAEHAQLFDRIGETLQATPR